MKLIYCYINKYRNIEKQEVYFSDKWRVTYRDGQLYIAEREEDNLKNYLVDNGFLEDLSVIVGKTGSGKTNLLQLIGEDSYSKRIKEEASYFLLYKKPGTNEFLIEIKDVPIKNLQAKSQNYHLERMCADFEYDFSSNQFITVKDRGFLAETDTYIVNVFDRYSFSQCPYDEIHQEFVRGAFGFLPRMVAQLGHTRASMEAICLKDYVNQFPQGSIKRKVSFTIQWNNWQDKIEGNLNQNLKENEYWTFIERKRNRQGNEANPHRIKSKKEISTKHRFLHDLMTDFAIYLRKWAETIERKDVSEALYYKESESKEGLEIDQVVFLPDGEKLNILKRIDWLCQYIDYHTDDFNGNKGLMWQVGSEIRDLYYLLDQMDEKYFTDTEFSIPVLEISLAKNKPMSKFFERIEQYRPDELGVFTQCLLPYHWTYVSSGEYQYAKVWGILEGYALKSVVMAKGDTYENAKRPNLILLLDEPECYMHPEMCRQFIAHMSEIIKRRDHDTEIQIILSTHSPFLLSDVLSNQIIRMDFDEMGKANILRNSKPSFAANIHSLMADSFFLEYTIGEQSRKFLSEKFKWLKDRQSQIAPLSQTDHEELLKLQSLLPEIGDEMIRYSFQVLIERLLS